MNDFKMIRADSNYRRLRPADLIANNDVTREFLSQELASLSSLTMPQLLTWRAMSRMGMSALRTTTVGIPWWSGPTIGRSAIPTSPSTLSWWMLSAGKQRGYPGEDRGFDPYKLIEIN